MSATQNKPPTKIPDAKFLFGGLSGMGATLFVQPLDLVKNRMQLSGEGGTQKLYKNSFHAVSTIVKNEGISGIYTGLSAGLLRQATYTTTRMGVFQTLLEKFTKDNKQPNFLIKTGLGVTAGGIAAYVGTPAEVALIRMTADGRLPPNERRGYKNVFNALYRITKEESLFGLWKSYENWIQVNKLKLLFKLRICIMIAILYLYFKWISSIGFFNPYVPWLCVCFVCTCLFSHCDHSIKMNFKSFKYVTLHQTYTVIKVVLQSKFTCKCLVTLILIAYSFKILKFGKYYLNIYLWLCFLLLVVWVINASQHSDRLENKYKFENNQNDYRLKHTLDYCTWIIIIALWFYHLFNFAVGVLSFLNKLVI